MSLVQVDGNIVLYHKVPLTANYTHSLYFESINEQEKYFKNHKLVELTSQNYVKSESGKIRIQVVKFGNNSQLSYKDIDSVSYMSWKNPTHSTLYGESRTFYAFITNIDMVSLNVVELTYELDVIQTYSLQYSSASEKQVHFNKCLVLRSHVEHDTVGMHLQPEPVSFSNPQFVGKHPMFSMNTYKNWDILVFSARNEGNVQLTDHNIFPGTQSGDIPVSQIMSGNIFQGCICTVFKAGSVVSGSDNAFYDFAAYLNTLQKTEDIGLLPWESEPSHYNQFVSNIIAVVAVPDTFVHTYNGGKRAPLQFDSDNSQYKGSDVAVTARPDSIDGYTQLRNKKLLTYPFTSLYITDGDGTAGEYVYEQFADPDNVKFGYVFAFQPDPELMIYPFDYNGSQGANFDGSLIMSNFPRIPIVESGYLEWLGTSKVSQRIAIGTSLIAGLGAVMTGGVSSIAGKAMMSEASNEIWNRSQAGGSKEWGIDRFKNQMALGQSIADKGASTAKYGAAGVLGGLSGMVNYMQQQADAKEAPPTVKPGSQSAMVAVDGKNFYSYCKTLRPSDAKRIDDFLEVYGYAVNDLREPKQSNDLRNYHYIQTSNCSVQGNAPSEYLRLIENIYNKGITFWKNVDDDKFHVGDYNEKAKEEYNGS